MSSKRRANVMAEYVVDDTSSDEDRNDDPRDDDFEVSSSERSAPGRQECQDSVVSNGSSCEPRRRGRGVSKRPCLNRNALMARENRQRKKEYLEKVESKLSFYRLENKNLTNVIKRQDIDLKRLRAEVSYLKNVLNNSSSITTLLKSMNDTLSVKKRNDSCVGKAVKNFVNENKIEKFDNNSVKCWRTNDTEKQWRRGGKYIDRNTTRRETYEIKQKKSNSIADSDHTYTTSRDGSVDEKLQSYVDSDDNASYGRDDRAFSQIDSSATKDRSAASLLGLSESEFDELPQFDANIFESLSNNCDITDTMDYLTNGGSETFVDDPGNLFESLENSGICLHVNSGKISLEFCSICHLNSINSTE